MHHSRPFALHVARLGFAKPLHSNFYTEPSGGRRSWLAACLLWRTTMEVPRWCGRETHGANAVTAPAKNKTPQNFMVTVERVFGLGGFLKFFYGLIGTTNYFIEHHEEESHAPNRSSKSMMMSNAIRTKAMTENGAIDVWYLRHQLSSCLSGNKNRSNSSLSAWVLDVFRSSFAHTAPNPNSSAKESHVTIGAFTVPLWCGWYCTFDMPQD